MFYMYRFFFFQNPFIYFLIIRQSPKCVIANPDLIMDESIKTEQSGRLKKTHTHTRTYIH